MMKALFFRDLKIAIKQNNNWILGVVFFGTFVLIVPLSIGRNLEAVLNIKTAVLWIGLFLSTLLTLNTLFQEDYLNGSLDIFISSKNFSFLTFIYIKCLTHWITTVLPLVLITPLFSIPLDLSFSETGLITFIFLLGTPAFTCIGVIGPALTLFLPNAQLLSALITFPFYLPILIFGVICSNQLSFNAIFDSPSFYFLIASTLFAYFTGPLFTAFTLRYILKE